MNNKIEFTDNANKEIERIILEKGRKTYFRISVKGGGCSGFKYSFSFDDKIKPDDKIFKYLKGKPMSPKNESWDKALEYWSSLKTDKDAKFDKEISLDGSQIKPMVTWGTSPLSLIHI